MKQSWSEQLRDWHQFLLKNKDPLLEASDVFQQTKVKAHISNLLNELRKKQIYGEILTRQEALEWWNQIQKKQHNN